MENEPSRAARRVIDGGRGAFNRDLGQVGGGGWGVVFDIREGGREVVEQNGCNVFKRSDSVRSPPPPPPPPPPPHNNPKKRLKARTETFQKKLTSSSRTSQI
jgi:hypothetical protein